MLGRKSATLLVILITSIICGCIGTTTSDPAGSQAVKAKDPAVESIWAVHFDFDSNTTQVQAVLLAGDSTTVTPPIKFSGFFWYVGTDPRAQLMFGQLLPFEGPDIFSRQRQLLVFRYDSTSAQMLSATEVPVPVGDYGETMAVVPALKSVYLVSPLGGGFVDFLGHIFLVHYDRDGHISEPIDASLENNPLSSNALAIDAYGEKTRLLYGGTFPVFHDPGVPVFASVTSDGLISSFRAFTVGNEGPPPVFVPCADGSPGHVLAYTRDGSFQIGYDPNQNVLIVASITSDGVTNFASRTKQLGTSCNGPFTTEIVRAAALDEAHHAFYAVLQTLDPFGNPASAVLAHFSFNSTTGAISSGPTQQISIPASTNRIYIPRFGSRVFIYDLFDHVSTNVTTYTLTDEGAQNPQQVDFAFSPDALFGDGR